MTTPMVASADRHRLIVDRLDALGRVDVADLASRLDVAQETIRRDLRQLERSGRLQRVHGGAVRRAERPLLALDSETPAHSPSHINLAETVAEALPATGSIYLGASPLTWAIAEALGRKTLDVGLNVITTSLDVAVLMSRLDSVRVYNIGGLVNPNDRAQQGGWALDELSRFRVDVAVLQTAGVTIDDGMFAETPMAAALAAAEVAVARRVWLLVEGDRLGRPGFVRAGSVDTVERIFTTGSSDPTREAPFRQAGITIVRSDPAGPDPTR